MSLRLIAALWVVALLVLAAGVWWHRSHHARPPIPSEVHLAPVPTIEPTTTTLPDLSFPTHENMTRQGLPTGTTTPYDLPPPAVLVSVPVSPAAGTSGVRVLTGPTGPTEARPPGTAPPSSQTPPGAPQGRPRRGHGHPEGRGRGGG